MWAHWLTGFIELIRQKVFFGIGHLHDLPDEISSKERKKNQLGKRIRFDPFEYFVFLEAIACTVGRARI